MDNTQEILDSIVLLINADKFLRELHAAKFQTLLRCIKCPNFGETMTKVDLIAGQLASVDNPPAEEENKTAEVPDATADDLD